MPLNEDAERKLVQWFKDQGVKPLCLECGYTGDSDAEWAALFAMNADGQFKNAGGGNVATVPLIALVCKKCGNIRLFSAVKMGLVSPLSRGQSEPPPATPPG